MTLIAYDELAAESWTRLEQAGDDPNHAMRVLVMATVCATGAPEARLMVLRGADRRLGKLWFYTDRRSEKVEQLRRQPQITAITYDAEAGVQLRLRGTASVDEAGALADQHWSQVGMAVRVLYASPDTPGRPLRQPDPRLMGVKRSIDAGSEATARGNFAVIELTVDSIEWLQIVDGE
ncbi:MAG: pyridoxamine 5'-phosphate oxidase family protein, partial [Planctomycetota bacterium]